MKDLAPVLIMAVVFAPIIVRMMLNHQRQMAELVHRVNQGPENMPQQAQMQNDIQDLKQLVQQQAIAIDNLSTKLDRVNASPMQDRLTAG